MERTSNRTRIWKELLIGQGYGFLLGANIIVELTEVMEGDQKVLEKFF